MKIRKRDGTMGEVDDGYILRDGEALVVGLPFMDSSAAWSTTGAVIPLGNDRAFCTAMRTNRPSGPSPMPTRNTTQATQRALASGTGPTVKPDAIRATAPQTFDSAEAAVAADAYAEYDRDISERWRR